MTEPVKNKATVKNDITPVKLKLSMEHTHKGESYKAGEQITLCKYQAERLQAANVGTIVNG